MEVKFFKRIAFFLLLLCVQTSVYAAYSTVAPSGQTLYYKIVSGKAQITSQNTSWPYYSTYPTGDLIIPATITRNGTTYSVTSIGDYAFFGCYNLSSITIPSSVTYIGEAFPGSFHLNNVYYTGNISDWCGIVFSSNNANPIRFADYFYVNNSIVSSDLIIPNGVSEIKSFVFYGYDKLSTVSIPASVTTIGSYAFDNSYICSLNIPDAVSSIGTNAFYSIKNINYNGSATGSPWGANTVNGYTEGYLIYKDATKKYLTGCCKAAEGTIVIPPSVDTIGKDAFSGCDNITSITIPSSVDTIGSSAFSGCYGLTSVYYTGDVAEWCGIDFYSSYSNPLYYAHNLYIDNTLVTDLVIPDGVNRIKDYAFDGASCLTSVTIPSSVDTIGGDAFENCTGLTSVYYAGDVAGLCSIEFNGNSSNPLSHAHNLYIDNTLVTDLVIPNSVNRIKGYTFDGASCLTSVIIPETVTQIGSYAFHGCTSICHLSVPSSVTSIDTKAFYLVRNVTYDGSATGGPWGALNRGGYTEGYFTYLDSTRRVITGLCASYEGELVIPSNIDSIGNFAFSGCTKITSVVFNALKCKYNSSFGPFTGGTIGNYYHLENITSFTFGDSVRIIPRALCDGLSGLTTVILPASIDTIGPYAFDGCGNLTTIWSYNPEAPYMDGTAGWRIPDTVYIPCDGSLESYIRKWGSQYNFHSMTDYSIFTFVDNELMGSVNSNLQECTHGTITATAYNGYHFSHWNDGNTDNPRSITLTQDTSFTAYFSVNQYTISVATNNAEQGSVGGGGTVEYMGMVSISATANYGYHFDHWNDGNTDNPCTVTVTGDATYTAYFALNQYTITVNCNNTSQGYVSGGGSYDYLSERTLTATSFYGYHFTHWNDGSTSSQRTITITQDTTFTAFFEVNQYSLTVYSNDESLGTVSGGGIFNYLDTAIISASVIAPHHHFVRWSDGYTDNPRRCVITGNKTLYATFAIDEHTVSVAVDDIAHGSVQASGTTFNYGSPCTVTATAYSGYTFSGWSNGMTDNPYTFAVLNDVDLIAYFVPTGSQPTTYYTITAVASDPSMGSVTGGGSYASGATATLMASANSGYHFTHWQDNNTINPRYITVTGNVTYTAYFESDGGGEQPSDNAPSIACVGVDMNGHNVVRWEPRQGVAVVRYNIYREGLGGYSIVGYVNATNATEYSWVDDNSNTATQAYSYKISEVSASGTESDLSLPHTTMHLQISQGQGSTWNLSWTPYVGFNYSGYRLYRGTSSASMSLLTELSSSATTYSDNAPSGDVYYQIEVVASGAKSITASSRSNIATSVQNQQFTITVLSDNNSMGTVSGGGTFAEGATATISATPLSGYTFSQWSDGSTQAQRTITVTGNATYTAYFTAGGSQPQQYLITVVSNNPERGTVSGGGLYDAGAVITITAEPFAGFEFVKWQDGNTEDFRTITVTADATYTAYFRTATEGINDVKTTDNIKVFTRGNTIVIDFSGLQTTDGRQSVVIYDVMGRVVKWPVASSQWPAVEIPVSGTGVYMVKVGEMKPQKVVVRR